jgi:hypothetical protein
MRVSIPWLFTALINKFGSCSATKLVYRICRLESPGNGDDQTRQEVPFPSTSTTCTDDKLSVEGNGTSRDWRAPQLLPAWL